MATITQLPRPERRRLQRALEKASDYRTIRRFQVVHGLSEGLSTTRVARLLDVAPSAVVRVRSRYLSRGMDALFDGRRGNGVRKVDDGFRKRLAQLRN